MNLMQKPSNDFNYNSNILRNANDKITVSSCCFPLFAPHNSSEMVQLFHCQAILKPNSNSRAN